MSLAAVIDEADLRVQPFELRVGEVQFHRRQDALTVSPHGPGQLHEGGYARTTGPTQTPLEVPVRRRGAVTGRGHAVPLSVANCDRAPSCVFESRAASRVDHR